MSLLKTFRDPIMFSQVLKKETKTEAIGIYDVLIENQYIKMKLIS